MRRPKKTEFEKMLAEVARLNEPMMKAIDDSLPQPGPGESPTAGIRILEPGERLPRYIEMEHPVTKLAQRDKHIMRFIQFKWEQLERADRRLGRTPSNETLLNRLKWIYDMALLAGLKMSQRRKREIESRRA